MYVRRRESREIFKLYRCENDNRCRHNRQIINFYGIFSIDKFFLFVKNFMVAGQSGWSSSLIKYRTWNNQLRFLLVRKEWLITMCKISCPLLNWMKLKIVFIDFEKLRRHRSEKKEFIDHHEKEQKRCEVSIGVLRIECGHHITVGSEYLEGKGSQLVPITQQIKRQTFQCQIAHATSTCSFVARAFLSLHVFAFLSAFSTRFSNDNNSFLNHDGRPREFVTCA